MKFVHLVLKVAFLCLHCSSPSVVSVIRLTMTKLQHQLCIPGSHQTAILGYDC